MVRELDLIRWVRERASRIGDDCAVLDQGLLVTTDSVIDGVHARWDHEGPAAFGYKAIARGMSDVAAMGGEPLWAVIAACLPTGVSEEEARAVVIGAESAGCPLVGGDTAFGPTAYVVGTVLGRHDLNISFMRLGRQEARGRALMVLGMDDDIPAEALHELEAIPDLYSARVVKVQVPAAQSRG